jgi:lipopolysaccharide transport system ATP-binding protein
VSEVAISAQGLGKKYRIGEGGLFRYKTVRESLMGLLRLATKPADDATADGSAFWALRNVAFDIKRGESVGIIGRNGAGKSTLLKILSRITDPTEGQAEIYGRVGSLLEVGTGFHPELTGRENIFLNGAILGMRRDEISRKFDEIVAFAETERFLDTPVKFYSSGMYTRLAFAVAAHLEPETLIVDEVLAVGDAAFQKKCLGKMGDIAKEGRTVLFVSHNMGAIRSLCGRAILLASGAVAFDGSPADAITRYLSSDGGAEEGALVFEEPASKDDDVALRSIRLLDPLGQTQGTHEAGNPIRVEIVYDVRKALRGARMNLRLSTQDGEIAFVSTDHMSRDADQASGRYRATCTIPGKLLNRRSYVVGVSVDVPGVRVVLPRREYLSFMVEGAGNQGSNFPESWLGVVCPQLPWTVESIA